MLLETGPRMHWCSMCNKKVSVDVKRCPGCLSDQFNTMMPL